MARFCFALLASCAILSGVAAAQTPSRVALLALSKQDHTLSIVDPTDMHIVATVPVGDDPHEVVASSDGKTAYVSNYGFGAFHTLAVIDLIAHAQKPFVELGALKGPHGLDFNRGKVFFTAEAAKAIGSYDPAAGQIDWIMGTGQDRTHMLFVFPDNKKIITTNVNAATVTVMEEVPARPFTPPPGMGPPPGSGGPPGGGPPPGFRPPPSGPQWELTVIPVGHGSEGFDISPDGKEAWTANAQDGTVSVIDLATKKVTATLDVNARGANRLKFTPDGRYVLLSANALVVLDAATHKEVKRLADVHANGGIQMQPDGARVYVACGRDNVVEAIDLKTWQKVGEVKIASPDGLAWAVQR